MCALLLKPHRRSSRDRWWKRPIHGFFGVFNGGFDALGRGYGWLAARVVRFAVLMLVVYAGIIAFGLNEFRKAPVGFIPQVDQGYLIVVTQLPGGASLARTDEVNRRVVDVALQVPGVAHAVNFVGFSGATFTNAPNSGAVFVALEPFAERAKDPQNRPPAIQAALLQKLSAIQEGLVLVMLRRPCAASAPLGGFRMMIEDRAGRGPEALQGAVFAMMGRAAQTPGVRQVFSLFESFDASALSRHRPHQGADARHQRARRVQRAADRSRLLLCQRLQPAGAHLPRDGAGGGRYRLDPKDVLQIRVRNSSGDTVPLGSFTTVRDMTGPYRVPRYNLYPAAELDGAPSPGYSQGQAIQIMQRLAAETLPDGFSYEWTTLAFQQMQAGNTAVFAFVLAVVFVFLVLAAQYESVTLPLAVILIVPMCLVASITGVILRGQDNNILTQVGFIVLIGLAAKNAILIVEFAKQLEDQGRDRWAAAVEAARLRLRPILMTSLAFIFGVVPLAWATGAGAELRQALGTAVFAGMIGVTAFGLIFTPGFYVICRWLANPKRWRRQQAVATAE